MAFSLGTKIFLSILQNETFLAVFKHYMSNNVEKY